MTTRSALDDDAYYITISPEGIATYNPMSRCIRPQVISEWSMKGVMFEARDAFDSSLILSSELCCSGVEFTAQRIDTGIIEFGDNAEFSGTGLPNKQVYARLVVESTFELHNDCCRWNMVHGNKFSDLGNEDKNSKYSLKAKANISVRMWHYNYPLKGEPVTEGVDSWVWIVIAIVVIAILLGRSILLP